MNEEITAESKRIGDIGSLLGDVTRVRMLDALLSGRAHTASELATCAGVSAPTASAHLKKLQSAALIQLEKQGRHRYFTLAGANVADALESVLRIGRVPATEIRTGPDDAVMRVTRTCYDHLAGRVAVALVDRFRSEGLIIEDKANFEVTDVGAARLIELGIDVDECLRRRRKFAPRCLDWSERRAHVGGALGAALLDSLVRHRVLRREPASRRIVIEPRGWRWLERKLGIERAVVNSGVQ